jgi:hypothetical protein
VLARPAVPAGKHCGRPAAARDNLQFGSAWYLEEGAASSVTEKSSETI